MTKSRKKQSKDLTEEVSLEHRQYRPESSIKLSSLVAVRSLS